MRKRVQIKTKLKQQRGVKLEIEHQYSLYHAGTKEYDKINVPLMLKLISSFFLVFLKVVLFSLKYSTHMATLQVSLA